MEVDKAIQNEFQLALAELESYLIEGEPHPCERVLREHVSLRDDVELFLELLYTEHLLREERGEFLTREDWIKRFPGRASDIDNLFRIQNYISDSTRTNADSDIATCTSEPALASIGNAYSRLGNYELIEKIGQGGMGSVYRARQLALNRIVCLKISSQRLTSNDIQRQLRDEAEIASRMLHPNIVPIYEAGVDNEVPYFSMEYVDGPSLAAVLQRGPLDFKTAASLVERLALAVSYAHSMGVIHRDIKPANILLADSQRGVAIELSTGTGQDRRVRHVEPKITDFGLAKRESDDQTATLPGTAIGTPSYMAPEQTGLTHSKSGPASDVYALGAVLYDCVAGRPPFHAATTLDTLLQVRSKDPLPLKSIQPDVPLDLETICLKCLNKAPEKRYASAAALAEDLKRFLERRPIQARRISTWERTIKWSHRHPAQAGLVASLILGTLGIFWQWMRAEYQWSQAVISANAANRAQIAEHEESMRLERTLYNNNVSLAHREMEANNVARTVQLLESCPVHLRNWEWFFLRDLAHRGVKEYGSLGMTVRSVAFNPNGKQVGAAASVFGKKTIGPVRLYGLDSNQEISLNGLKFPVTCLDFSPDGKRVGTLSRANETPGAKGGFAVWDATTGQMVSHNEQPDGYALRFNTDGTKVALGETLGLSIYSVDGQLLHQLPGHSGTVFDVAWSPDGTKLLSGSRDRTARIWDVQSGSLIRVLRMSEDISRVAWANSGNQIAIGTYVGNVSSFEYGPDDDEPRELFKINEDAVLTALQFSPDSQYLAMSHLDRGTRVVNAWDGKPTRVFSGHSGVALDLKFGNEGASLLTGGSDGRTRICDLTVPQIPNRIRLPGPFTSDLQFVPGTDEVLMALNKNTSMGARYRDKTLRLWNYVEKKSTGEFGVGEDWQTTAAVHPSGHSFVSGGEDGTVRVWNRDQPIAEAEYACGSPILRVRYLDKGRHFAAVTGEGLLHVWRSADNHLLWKGNTVDQPITMATAIDTPWVAVAGDDRLRLVHALDRSHPPIDLNLKKQIHQLAMSPDGSLLAGATEDSEILLWDMSQISNLSGRVAPYVVLSGHTEPVSSLCFSEDGSRLCSSSPDRSVKLWDVKSGQIVLSLRFNAIGDSTTIFSTAKNCILSISGNNAALWSIDEPSQEQPLTPPSAIGLERFHRDEMAKSNRASNWYGVQYHATRLIEAVSNSEEHNSKEIDAVLRQRARTRSQLRNWEAALDDFQAISNKNLNDRYAIAVLAKGLHRTEVARDVVDYLFLDTDNSSPDEANSRLWTAVQFNSGLPLQAEVAMKKLEGKRQPNYFSTLAAVKYRQGLLEEAHGLLLQGQSARGGKLVAEEQVLLAMVLVRQGQTEQAARYISAAKLWLDQQRQLFKKRQPVDPLYSSLHDFETQLFIEEYDELREQLQGEESPRS